MASLTVAQLAALCDGRVEGDSSFVITGANSLQKATAGDLSFVASQKSEEAARKSAAGCLLVSDAFDPAEPRVLIRAADPRTAFAKALMALYPRSRPAPSVHPTALITETARIADDCFIGPYVVVGGQTSIGRGSVIGARCTIGDRVTIGPGARLYPNVTVYDDVTIGARVTLHSGCVIGADGFGFTFAGDHYEKFPQVGTVAIGDDVEIGANSCVDRAALGVTAIGSGTKLDNLIHVAHNCTIGRHVVVAAQTGFSGSVTVGDYAVIGGQAGIGEKAVIDAKAIVGGGSGIISSQRIEAGEAVWGMPARPLRQHLKNLAQIGKIATTRDEVKTLKKRLDALESSRRE